MHRKGLQSPTHTEVRVFLVFVKKKSALSAISAGQKQIKKGTLFRVPFLRGAWRSRTALVGFADRRLNRSSNAPNTNSGHAFCGLAGAKVIYFSLLRKFFLTFFAKYRKKCYLCTCFFQIMHYELCIMHYGLCIYAAPVAKLVDALDLGSNVIRCAGSSPVRRTKFPFQFVSPARRFFQSLRFLALASEQVRAVKATQASSASPVRRTSFPI